jgi:hypothetical protein
MDITESANGFDVSGQAEMGHEYADRTEEPSRVTGAHVPHSVPAASRARAAHVHVPSVARTRLFVPMAAMSAASVLHPTKDTHSTRYFDANKPQAGSLGLNEGGNQALDSEQAKRLCGLEVEDQLDFRHLLYRYSIFAPGPRAS